MARIFTGAKAKIFINEALVGFVGGLNVNQENTLNDVDVIGQLEVGDLAETGHKINFSINYFKAVQGLNGTGDQVDTAALLGLDTGAADGVNSMRNQTYFNVVVQDDQDREIYKMEDCKWEGGSGSVNARGLWEGTWNFRARKGFGL